MKPPRLLVANTSERVFTGVPRVILYGEKKSRGRAVRFSFFKTSSSKSEDIALSVADSHRPTRLSESRSHVSRESHPSSREVQIVQMEELVEKAIYRCRFLALLAVLGSLVGSVLCFLKGCYYVVESFKEYFLRSGMMILMLVEAIDVYLIGTVMIVFGVGLYELFISNLDIAKTLGSSLGRTTSGSSLFGMFTILERPKWLEIKSVNDLKTKLGHVIVLVLLVGLFEKCTRVIICTPHDLVCFSASILLSSGGLFLLSKLTNSKHEKNM